MIITLDLCFRRGSFSIIEGLNLHIEKGEFVFVCGQSGTGKSSLLRIFALQMFPSEGRVIIEGIGFGDIIRSGLSQYRRTLGIVFPEDLLLPRRTLGENIQISLMLAGWEAGDARRETNNHLREIGLLGKANLFPWQISENEKQLVKVCRAAARRPKIILADEPYEGLDGQSADKAAYLLQRAHLRGSTVVIATHGECAERGEKRLIRLDNYPAGRETRASAFVAR